MVTIPSCPFPFPHFNPANPVYAVLQACSVREIIDYAEKNIESHNRITGLINDKRCDSLQKSTLHARNEQTLVQTNINLLCVSLVIIQRIAFVTMQYVPSWPVTIALHMGIVLSAILLQATGKNTLRGPNTSPTRVNSVCNAIFDYITPLQNTIIVLSLVVLAIYQDIPYVIGAVSMGIIQHITPERFSPYLRVASNLITLLVSPILFLRFGAAYALVKNSRKEPIKQPG